MNLSSDPPGPESKPAKSDRYPGGIPFIVGNEGAERFSYYGMRAILYIYLTALYVQLAEKGMVPQGEGAAEAYSTEITHLFFAGVYLFPLVGAVLSDRLLGKYHVILYVSLLYCLGHGALAVAGRMGEMGNFEGAQTGMYIGLSLIALGSGGIKPCVSANVGDQFTKENGHLISRVFQIFYFIINFGSFFSNIITPYLYHHANFGPEIAFGVPGILMGIATIVFWLGRKKFVLQPPKPGGKLGAIDFTSTLLLFSPFFALIYGYKFMWGHFKAPADASVLGYAGAFLAYYSWLLIAVACAMGAGFWLFGLRQKMREDDGFLAVIVYALRNRRLRQPGQTMFDVARDKFGQEAGDGPPAVLRIGIVFSMVIFFWALFDQHASTWVAQAKRMDLTLTVPQWLWYYTVAAVVVCAVYGGTWIMLHVSNVTVPRKVNLLLGGFLGAGLIAAGVADAISQTMISVDVKPEQVQSLNPLMVMMIIPFLTFCVWTPLRKRGIVVKPLQRMTLGMFLAAVSFVIAALLQVRIEAVGDFQVHFLWQVAQYVIMTTAEVLVSVTGLEFAYTQAPRAMKSTIMGFWLLLVTFGNLIVAFLAPLQKSLELSGFFWIFAALMAAAAVIFAVLAYFYKGKSYLQDAES